MTLVPITLIEGTAVPLRGDDIDTDRIIPARYLTAIRFEGLEGHVFEDDRSSGHHPFHNSSFRGGSILIVNRNFGCGSSREHAPQAIRRWGIRAIMGESFADIFFGNATSIGLPCVTAAKADVDALMAFVEQHPRTIISVDLKSLLCESDAFTCVVRIPAAAREAFVNGAWDTTTMLLDRFDEVRGVASRLPYLTAFHPPRTH
jgi:3-isopropylmalate/(R)-2-methylmalate dehydratase small subunit